MSEMKNNIIEIRSVKDLLDMKLFIPDYQRPYKWTIPNIESLLNDISNCIKESEKFNDFKYRIGTIILHEADDIFNIVDGQQRIISMILLKYIIDENFKNDNFKFNNKISQKNIHDNYNYIKEWFLLKGNEKEKFKKAIENNLEVVVITVKNINEAFQLFDSQNTRGKSLDPHALLKAYHLREMQRYPYEMERAVEKWEAKDPKDIHNLFALYFFPIWNWEKKIKSKAFTAKDIDIYKGIPENSSYTYAKRVSKAMPYFQIAEPFIAGNDFFEMISHYMSLLEDIEKEIKENKSFASLEKLINNDDFKHSAGFSYAKNLFYCALLYYYDKFHNFDEMVVKKIFIWAFIIRLDMSRLGFDTINKYAIGEENSSYTNNIPMFYLIKIARLHNEISRIQIKVTEKEKISNKNWQSLYEGLNKIIGETHG